MRVSDAERNEIAEALSKHYGEGRLDAAEFQERLDRAMGAKTRADFAGLLSDLPSIGPAEKTPMPRRRPRALAVLVALLVLATAWSAAVASRVPFLLVPHVPWLLIGLIVFFVWRRDRFGRRYRYRRRVLDERPW